MQDLVKATGLHPGSLYGAFNNKENLFNECIKSDLSALFVDLEDTFSAHKTAYLGVDAYFRFNMNDALQSPDETNLRFIFKASHDLDEELTESCRLISEAIDDRNNRIISYITQAQLDGDIRDDLSPAEINAFLSMSSLGLRCMQQFYPDPGPKARCMELSLEFIKAQR